MAVLYIKNMVCDRCKMAVESTLLSVGLKPLEVELGKVSIEGTVDEERRRKLSEKLENLGFHLLESRRERTVEAIKTAVRALVRYPADKEPPNLSTYVSQQLNLEYSTLSKVFSEITGTTIERYYIFQRIERVKELIDDDELTLSQIAQNLHYSSVAYLSNQFRGVVHMTPSEYRESKESRRKSIDEL
jgi:AraC family transcriptional regulator